MFSVRSIAYGCLQYIRKAKPHPGLAHLPLLGSPWSFATIVGAYLLFVFKWGPAYMKNRQPYNLRKVLLVYNFAQIVMCSLLNYYATWGLFFGHSFDLGCITVAPDDHPYKHIETAGCYTYFILKVIDLLDTVFFVLRKSQRQVTFLHVYHHVLMVVFVYCYLTYYGAMGHLSGVAYLNSIVHTFMYIYYFGSAFSPSVKNSIWIKKSITIMQITQFVLIFAHQLYPLIWRPDCEYPKLLLYFGMFQAVVMIILFGNFYRKAYLQPKNKVECNGHASQNGGTEFGVHKCILSTGVQIGRNGVSVGDFKMD